jgi:hypothetical protein
MLIGDVLFSVDGTWSLRKWSACWQSLRPLHSLHEALKAHSICYRTYTPEPFTVDRLGILLDTASKVETLGCIQLSMVAIGQEFAESLLGP